MPCVYCQCITQQRYYINPFHAKGIMTGVLGLVEKGKTSDFTEIPFYMGIC